MSSAARDIKNSLANCLSTEAGVEYNELKYLSDLSLNSFTGGHDKRYGVRPGATPRNNEAEVNKSLTYTQTFEIVLTKGCTLTGVSDTERYEAFLDLHEIALRFQKRVINTKAGLPSRVINAINFNIEAPDFLEDKVAVLTGTIDIIYRIGL